MKNYKKAIEDAAKVHGDQYYDDFDGNRSIAKESFSEGAKSEAAKEFWQQNMYTEKAMSEALHLGIEGATRAAKSKMYSEQEMLLFAEYVRDSACSDFERKSIGLVSDDSTEELFGVWTILNEKK